MSAIANVVAFDGEAVPVSHTFKPVFVRNENGKQVATYRESVNGVPLEAQPLLTLTQETLKSGVSKLTARLSMGVMESVSGQNAAGYTAPPKVAYTVQGECVIFAPGRSTPQQRKTLRYLLTNVLTGNVNTVASSSWNTGPVPELIDDVVSPT